MASRALRLRRKVKLLARRADAMAPVVRAARRYVAEIDAPDIKVPFSIANMRLWLVDAVRRFNARAVRS